MDHMTFEQFKLHTGKWGFMSLEVANDSLVNKNQKQIGQELFRIFRERAAKEGAILVKGSLHAYNDMDKQMFGFSVSPDHTAFVIYVVK